MNLLVFVFSLLMIFSYSFFISFEKFNGERRMRNTYLGHMSANRQIISAYENELYKSFPSKENPILEARKRELNKTTHPPRIPATNPDCSRINIGPLLTTGIEENRFLYDLTAKLLRTFYGAALFEDKPRAEYKFLNALIEAAKKHNHLPLEKIDFKNGEMQEIYYQMLKGTKKLYPSLLDYIEIEPTGESKICLFHAHPRLIAILFGDKSAMRIFNEMHLANALPITQEAIERLCSEDHSPIFQPEVFKFLILGKPDHMKGGKKALIETDTDTAITLRKDLFIKA